MERTASGDGRCLGRPPARAAAATAAAAPPPARHSSCSSLLLLVAHQSVGALPFIEISLFEPPAQRLTRDAHLAGNLGVQLPAHARPPDRLCPQRGWRGCHERGPCASAGEHLPGAFFTPTSPDVHQSEATSPAGFPITRTKRNPASGTSLLHLSPQGEEARVMTLLLLTQMKLMFDSVHGETAAKRGGCGGCAERATMAILAILAMTNHTTHTARQRNTPKVATSPCRFCRDPCHFCRALTIAILANPLEFPI